MGDEEIEDEDSEIEEENMASPEEDNEQDESDPDLAQMPADTSEITEEPTNGDHGDQDHSPEEVDEIGEEIEV